MASSHPPHAQRAGSAPSEQCRQEQDESFVPASELERVRLELERVRMERDTARREHQESVHLLSHDLSNPLREVLGFAELLDRRYGHTLEPDGRELLRHVVDGARRMRAMLEGLLAYSRVSTGGPPVPVDATDVLDGVLRRLQACVRSRGAFVTRDPLPVVLADPEQLGQLFARLLENALDHHPGTPRVHVGGRPEDGSFRFEVTDDGPGFAVDLRGRAFSLFTRGEGGGAGVGLAVVARIVARFGGRVGIESAPGGGSVVWFTLPTAPATTAGGEEA